MAFTYSTDGKNSSSANSLNTTHFRARDDGSSRNTSLLTRENSTEVELYTTVLCTTFLFCIAVLGIVTNVTVLLASRMKKSVRTLQYGLHYGLATVNIIFCSIWLPLHIVQIITNFQGLGLHTAICFTNIALFNFCLAVVIFLIFFLAIQRLYQLSALPMQNLRQVVTRGFVASFTIGVIAAAALTIEFPWNIDYKVCTLGIADNARIGDLWFSVAAILFTVIYTLVLLITMLILWIATLAVRHKIRQMVCKQDSNSYGDHLPGGSLGPIEMSETDASHAKSMGSVTFEHTSGATTSSRKDSITESNQSQSRSQSRQLVFIEPKKTDSEEEDDDTFDMKMRMRHQKNSSGRRHTVANIGLGDSFFGFGKRRGSLEESKPKPNYNYIRKWSVDITALQDQLENPKTFTADFTKDKTLFPKSLKPEKESINEESIAEDSIAEHEEEKEEETQQEPEETKKKKVKMPDHVQIIDQKEETDIDELQEEPEESDPLAESMEAPAIVVNGNSPQNQANRVDFADTDNSGVDADTLQKFHKEVVKTNKCIFLQFMTLVCLLPYTILQLLQPLMGPRLNRNLTFICMGLCLIMCSIHPAVLVWMDRRLQQAIKKLRNKLTNWKCVCYCNIGKGKNCFGRPHELEGSLATTVLT